MPYLLLFLLTLFLSSCATQRNYYVLSPIGSPPSSGGPGIGVGPIDMADYLVERPYVTFQSSPNRLEISDLHEWAGDLRNDFGRVLASGLGKHRGSGNVYTYPWDRQSELKYQVTLDIRRFHGTSDGDALLEVAWRAYALPSSRIIKAKTSILREPMEIDGFEELVAAQSRLIDRLASEIASSLR